MIKKVFKIFICLVLILSFESASYSRLAIYNDKDIRILTSISETGSDLEKHGFGPEFIGYKIVNDQLYVNLGDCLLFFEYKTDIMKDSGIERHKPQGAFMGNAIPFSTSEDPILVKDKTIEFLERGANQYEIFVNGKSIMKVKNGYYYYNEMYGYIYVDKNNEKIYFDASFISNNGKDKEHGLYTYNLKTKQFALLLEGTYGKTIRIPSTPYLLFLHNEGGKVVDICTLEIPEWKEEIEQQKKNIKNNPTAKEWIIDGPANIRDNINGKVIASIDNGFRVLVVDQKSDWYQVLYADIKGWTHKQNLIEIKPK